LLLSHLLPLFKLKSPTNNIGVLLLLDLPDSETIDIKLMLAMLTKSSRGRVFQKNKSSTSTSMMSPIPNTNIRNTKENFSTSQPRLELPEMMFMPVVTLTLKEDMLPLRTSWMS